MADRLRRAWNGFFYTGFSGDSLGLLRIAFGAGLFLFHFTQFDNVFRYTPGGAHFHYLDPIWYFDLLGVESHDPWLTFVFFAALLATTVTLTLGLWTRSSILLLILCILYLKGARDSVAGDVHHRYLIPFAILFFLLLSRCGEVRSLDARRRERRGEQPAPLAEWEASWPIRAMQVYVCSFYFWGGLAKLRVSGWDWVADGERIQHLMLKRALVFGVGPDGRPLWNPLGYELAQHPELCMALALATLVMELGFPVLLFLRSARAKLTLLAGVAFFHLATLVTAYVGFVLMPVAYLVFFDLSPVWRRIRRRRGPEPLQAPASGS